MSESYITERLQSIEEIIKDERYSNEFVGNVVRAWVEDKAKRQEEPKKLWQKLQAAWDLACEGKDYTDLSWRMKCFKAEAEASKSAFKELAEDWAKEYRVFNNHPGYLDELKARIDEL